MKQHGVHRLLGFRVDENCNISSFFLKTPYCEAIVFFWNAHFPKGIKVVVEVAQLSDNYALEDFEQRRTWEGASSSPSNVAFNNCSNPCFGLNI